MHDVDYLSSYEGMNSLSKYMLNEIEVQIVHGNKDEALLSIKNYKRVRKSLKSFNFYSSSYDKELNSLEEKVLRLPEKINWVVSGKRAYE